MHFEQVQKKANYFFRSLTDEKIIPDRDGDQHADILFDLHKKSLGNSNSNGINGGSASATGNGSIDDDEVISVGQFLKSLETNGIRRNDPRLKPMMQTLNEVLKERKLLGGASAMDSLLLDRETFRR